MSDHPLRKGVHGTTTELVARLQVIRPSKGDLIVVTMPEGTGMESQALMMEQLRALELGVRLVILADGLELHHLLGGDAVVAKMHYDELHAILKGESNRAPPSDR